MLTPLNQQLDQSTAPAAPPMPMASAAPPMATEGPTMVKQPFNNPNPPPSPGVAPSPGIGAQIAAQGRGPDSMLVHMAPSEVKGLDALARQHMGQGLTTNPQTGLPEAGILSSLLPMVIGAVLTPLTGGLINPMTAGLLVGAGTGLIKHDLGAGLMAGLSAYGGAGLGAALFGGGATAGALFGSAGDAAKAAAAKAATSAATTALPGAATAGASLGAGAFPAAQITGGVMPSTMTAAQQAGMKEMLAAAAQREAATSLGANAGLSGIKAGFDQSLRAGVPSMVPKMVTSGLGTTGIMSGLSGAMTPGAMQMPTASGLTSGKPNYLGPYKPVERKIIADNPGLDPNNSGERQWFDNVNPYPGFTTAEGGIPPGYPGGPPLILPADKTPEKKKNWWDFAEGGSTPAPKAKKNFFENSLPLGLVGALSGVGAGGGGEAGGGHSSLGNLGALAALGGLGGMGLMQAMGGGDPLAALKQRLMMTPSAADIDPETGLPRRRLGMPEAQSPAVGAAPAGMAKGGPVALKPGGFVMDARTVSELGNGNTDAGQEVLSRLGGKPIKGRGDGVGDNIPAKIKGKSGTQAARVSSGEVKFDPKTVRKMGGPQKLYAIMQQAERSRAMAGRGKDNRISA